MQVPAASVALSRLLPSALHAFDRLMETV